jgi:hypothetical protein
VGSAASRRLEWTTRRLSRSRADPHLAEKLSRRKTDVFLNVPYDNRYEPLLIAFIAGACRFGLTPRATIEIPGSRRRLDRIVGLVEECAYSFHDLSRVTLDRNPPATPRFNMPFELGLAVARAANGRQAHEWYLFESKAHRLNKSLSDLDGTDPYIHDGRPEGVLRAMLNALVRKRNPPTLPALYSTYRELRTAASKLKKQLAGASLFEARAFKELVTVAVTICSRESEEERTQGSTNASRLSGAR